MFLREGVKIYTKLQISERIFLSSGIERATTINGVPCNHKAFLPKPEWRSPTKEELNLLLDLNTKPDFLSQVAIIKLPTYLQTLLRKSGVQDASSKRNLDHVASSEKFKVAYQALLKYIESFQGVKEEPKIHSIGQGPKGLANSSYDFNKERYVGLHVDSWDMKPLAERHLSRNRILINLGKDPRYFLFVNQEMKDIKNFISYDEFLRDEKFENIFLNIDRFFEENSHYPVIKIKLNPFEGYIAPTDNIIHDGNTEEQGIMDIFLTARSFYNCYRQSNIRISFKELFKFK